MEVTSDGPKVSATTSTRKAQIAATRKNHMAGPNAAENEPWVETEAVTFMEAMTKSITSQATNAATGDFQECFQSA